MRIVYLCQYFVPEAGAPAARLRDMARSWVQRGHSVTVVTGMPNHPTGVVQAPYVGRLIARESLDGVTVLRNWLYATPNEGLVRKTLSHLSFMVSALVLGNARLGTADVIIASSPSFFAVISAWVMSRMRKIPFVFEVRDLWPAVFVDLGVLTNSFVIRALESVEMFLYRRAALVVTVTEGFRTRLIARGLPPQKVVTVTNGAAIESFTPGPRDNAVRTELGLAGKFVVGYIGAHGISQGLELVLQAAQRLRDDADIVFLLVGEGARKRALLELRETLRLTNVIMLPAQAHQRVREYYCASDVCVVPLRQLPLFATFIPSKMFEIMACAVPVIGALEGEAREILERSGGARLIVPEDAAGLADAVRWFKLHPGESRQMGAAGRAFVTANYDRQVLADRYAAALQALLV
ncbi:MAG: glycosyltransferase WbuB [Chloroflexi bacterium]|nr:MAG: glycosyltransferase WbuB [Chloroflexota bacterium]